MLNKVSIKLSNEVLKRVEKANYGQEVYVYGIEIILSTLLEIMVILVSACFFSVFKEGFIFVILFMSLRIFTGGYHANTYKKCFIVTVGSFWGMVLLANIIENLILQRTLYMIMFAAAIYIVLRSPILNKNQLLNEKKIAKNVKMTAIVLMIQIFLITEILDRNKKLLDMAILTLCLVAVFMLLTDIKYIKERGKIHGIIIKDN